MRREEETGKMDEVLGQGELATYILPIRGRRGGWHLLRTCLCGRKAPRKQCGAKCESAANEELPPIDRVHSQTLGCGLQLY